MADPSPVKQAKEQYAMHWFDVQTKLNQITLSNARLRHTARILGLLAGGALFITSMAIIFGFVTSPLEPGTVDPLLVGLIGAAFGGGIVSYGGIGTSKEDRDTDVPPIDAVTDDDDDEENGSR